MGVAASIHIGSPIGLGMGGEGKEPVNAAADVKGLIAAFEGSRAPA